MPRYAPGSTFGRLTVTEIVTPPFYGKSPIVSVVCVCGARKTVRAYDMVHGKVKSCGCLKREQDIRNAARLRQTTFDRECEVIASAVDDRIRYYSV